MTRVIGIGMGRVVESDDRALYGRLLPLAAAVSAAYAFSPLSVIVGAAMCLLLRRAARGLQGMERRWVLGVLITGLGLRALALIGLFVTTNPWREQIQALFGDGHYSIQRSLWILNDWQDIPIGPWYRFNVFGYYAVPSFDRVLAAVQWFIGPSPYALPLISVAAFFAGTVLLYRLARRSFGPAAALTGLVLLVFWPTFFVWSISMLKESAQLFLYAATISAAVTAARIERWGVRAALLGVILAAAYLIAPLRAGSHLILLGTVVFGYAFSASLRRSSVFVALISCIVVGGALAAGRPSVQALVRGGVYFAMDHHIGNVRTPGNSYMAADRRFYTNRRYFSQIAPPTFDECVRFLIRSAAMFVLVPLPVHIVNSSGLAFVPQQLAWLLLLAFACWGAWVGFRRDPLLTGMCVGHCLAAAAVIAPNSGNIGTLIRHRDIIVPLSVWLSGLGVMAALGTIGRTHHASD